MAGPAAFTFLNREHALRGPKDWNNPQWDKLWVYNLHYFEDLNAEGAEERREWHLALMRRWVAENPPGVGNGWEPYPTSLRVVNWIKWALAGNTREKDQGNRLDEELLHSLAVQVRWLVERLEYHLLGNHLFANAKALVFAGLFFQGAEAEEWLEKGLNILAREVPEQILPDGGHFERSPMYHSIILEDLLDLINIQKTYGELPSREWNLFLGKIVQVVMGMRAWLAAMCHPDGEIALFNDAAFDITPTPAELEAYAQRLGLDPISIPRREPFHMPPMGYVHMPHTGYMRVEKGPAVALLDVGPIGPDYLPGHAHADTLSFELSLHGHRAIVDTGTSCYGPGPERQRQRSTAAHNTVTVDGEDSSEVWGGFRVARRAYPLNLTIENTGDEIRVACSHDGYRRLPGKVFHRREWLFRTGQITIRDTLEGRFTEAVARIHFHPDVMVHLTGPQEGDVILPDGHRWTYRVTGGTPRMSQSTYHPRFGVSIPNSCIRVSFHPPVTQITQVIKMNVDTQEDAYTLPER